MMVAQGPMFHRNSARSLHQDQGEVLGGSHAGNFRPVSAVINGWFLLWKNHKKADDFLGVATFIWKPPNGYTGF